CGAGLLATAADPAQRRVQPRWRAQHLWRARALRMLSSIHPADYLPPREAGGPTPLVSVVMSVYNDGKYVKDAIESILAQTFTDFEFVIVDDGCTDNTRDIIAGYHDARIRLIVNEHNLGLAPSLNKAIRLSGAQYI